MTDYAVYLDKLGRRWIRLDEETIWNSDVGFGGWYKGNDLVSFDFRSDPDVTNPPTPTAPTSVNREKK